MENKLGVSIILPAYNENKNLKALIPKIHNALSKYNIEIIVVDDASNDGTLNDLDIVYIYNKKRQGLGKSIKTGIEKASKEIIIIMDSDGDHNPNHLHFMIENLKFCDIVISSRFMDRSEIPGSLRSFLSRKFNTFVRAMTGGKLTDYLYGYWATKKSVLEKISLNQIFWGYGDYCIRLLYYLEKLNLNIQEVACIAGKRKFGRGNLRFLRTFSQYTIAVIILMLKERISSVQKNKILQNL